MSRRSALLAAASLATLLSGCSNNNDNVAAPTPIPPGGFDEIGPNETVSIGGSSRVVQLNDDGTDVTVTSGPTVAATTFTLTTDGAGDIDSLRVEAPDVGIDRTMDSTNATVVQALQPTSLTDPANIIVTTGTANDSSFEVAASAGPAGAEYNYQTFGRWVQQDSATDSTAGYFSVGFSTETAGVPTSGELTYDGVLQGNILQDGDLHETFANIEVVVDFGVAQDFTVAATNTVRSTGGGGFSPAPSIDFAGGGSLTDTALSGTISASGGSGSGGLSGTLDGMLYGPTAEEVGGTFALANGTDGRLYVGAFGAAR